MISGTDKRISKLALVLTGGGARGAYQAGVLRGLGRQLPELRFPIVTGVSAGAINASYLASHPGPLPETAEALARMWGELEVDDVFRADFLSLTWKLVRWLFQLGLGVDWGSQAQGFLDTEPLFDLLRRELGDGEIAGIARNIEAGRLDAVSLATVNYATGQTINWVQGRDVEHWTRPSRRSRECRLTARHVMASAALPMLFPAVRVEGAWYGDGGVRMSAPLSPALHLGADRLLAVSTQYPRSQREADAPSFLDYPPPAQIAGNLLNAVFLDVIDQDTIRLERLNALIRRLPEGEREGLKPVEIVVMRPSQDLGKLSAHYEPRLPRAFRFLSRNAGSRDTKSPDSLSLLMFQSDYLRHLMDVGEQDVETRLDEIRALVEPATAAPDGIHLPEETDR